ncbi:MAG TPA: DEAD/DEAH box helicase, partial [Flavobacteriia bacterium]|nr:DEAD/DEAH box helicase [Flavobacteriia bacterium]
AEKGYTKPSPIQEKAIPLILQGKDILASAQTGTGKTAGFTLPMLQKLSETKHPKYRPIRALILTPTRELAAQIYDNILAYSKYVDVRTAVIFGGVKPASQIAAINRGVGILVATPGRLLDLESQNKLSLKRVQFLVLDEADRMLDMGFQRDINKILALLPAKRQNLLFSATFSKEIKKLANNFLTNPIMVESEPENSTVDKIVQRTIRTDKSLKGALIMKLIKEGNWQQVLVFTRTKHGANRLTKKMISNGIQAAAIHGNKSQGARTKALAGFKDGSVRVLVATDIAARGLDIPLLPHVINFELPNIAEDYVHRIGRTGRAGANGEAISLVSSDELNYLKNIEKLVGIQLKPTIIKGFEPSKETPENEKPITKEQRQAKHRQFRERKNNHNPKGNKPASGKSKKRSFSAKKNG